MEELYRFDDRATITCSNIIDDDVVRGENFGDVSTATNEFHTQEVGDLLHFEGAITESPLLVSSSSDFYALIKTQIANHPRYPDLLSAYIDCRKVGAPPEMASLLEEIGREQNFTTTTICNDLGVDPELDEFMDSYCEILQRYKEELSKPFDEVTTFLTNIESQLNNLCNDSLTTRSCDYGSAAKLSRSSSEASGGENDQASESQESPGGNDEGIKGMLLWKYSGYLSKLRKEFMKKRKRGKLPKDAKSTLLHCWNSHYRWPYPKEEEKMKLGEITGLDQKQINNWFINQRKRHWKPSEDIRLVVVEGVRGTMAGSEPVYFDTAANDTIT